MKHKIPFIIDGFLAAVLLDISAEYEVSINYSKECGIILRLIFIVLTSLVFYFSTKNVRSRKQLCFDVFVVSFLSYVLTNILLLIIRVGFPFSYFPIQDNLSEGSGFSIWFGRLYLIIPMIFTKTFLLLFRFIRLSPKFYRFSQMNDLK